MRRPKAADRRRDRLAHPRSRRGLLPAVQPLEGRQLLTGTASFIRTDAATQGGWQGHYGADGFNIIGDAASYPAYATVTPSGQTAFTWASSTTDVRALLRGGAGETGRIAACWYSVGQFTIDLDLTDGEVHEVSLYALAWDGQDRQERIDIVDPSDSAVLDSQTIGSFNGGEYLSWNLSGHVQIQVTRLAGPNAVVSGLFFDPPPGTATFVGTDTATQGNWQGAYGADGFNVIGDAASYPAYAAVTPSGQTAFTWASSTADVRALQRGGAGETDRIAATWFGAPFTIDVNLTDGQAHKVSLYALDWDSTSRQERIDVVDPTSGAVLDTRTLSSFSGGEYLTWALSGHVQLRVTRLAGANAVVSGLFFDQAVPPAPIGLTATAISPTQIALSWSDVAGETGYVIERSTNWPGFWEQVATTGANVTAYTDSGLTRGTPYFYRVLASNGIGESDPGDTAAAAIGYGTPTVAVAASAGSGTVTGTTADLSVLGDVDGGESELTYTWSVASLPDGALPPSFSDNGTNAAKSVTATFSMAGDYTLRATIADGTETVTSDVTVTVEQTLTSIVVTPAYALLVKDQGYPFQFAAKAEDQFGDDMETRPSFTWSLASGPGQISSYGLYTPPSSGVGAATVQATAGGITGTVQVAPGSSEVIGVSSDYGPLYITAAPSSARLVSGGTGATTWMNVVNEAVSYNDAFSGFNIEDRGYANLSSNSVIEMAFDAGTLFNGPLYDLVLLDADPYSQDSYAISTSFDNFATEWIFGNTINPLEWTVISKDYFYGGSGPYSRPIMEIG